MRYGTLLGIVLKVSIHAPWEGCDDADFIVPAVKAFQFTHPGKGATFTWVRMLSTQAVSIHAPWEGCDQ